MSIVGKSIYDSAEDFTYYRAQLQFRDLVCGTIPNDPKVMEGHVKNVMGVDDKAQIRQFTQKLMGERLGQEVVADLTEEQAVAAWNAVIDSVATDKKAVGFKRDAVGLYIESRQIKAAIKESTNILWAGVKFGARASKRKEGANEYAGKNAKAYLTERVFINPDRLYLMVDKLPYGRQPAKEASGTLTITGTVFTPQGQKQIISVHEYVERATIDLEFMVHGDCVTREQWGTLWKHMQENGLGGVRGQGHGRFNVTEFTPGRLQTTPNREVAHAGD